MIPPPPSSTLFPYTTLFRSAGANNTRRTTWPSQERAASATYVACPPASTACAGSRCLRRARAADSKGSHSRPGHSSVHRPHRSEEHTSELQSHVNLVCRLLL